MIYTDLTKTAMKLAYEAHKGQLDKSGVPYIYHPVHLAEQMEDEISTCVALLHDVVEDTEVTLRELEDMGFPQDVVEAVELMIHEESVPYMEYVRNLKHHPIARRVKLADLRHNSDVTRMEVLGEKDLRRREKYLAAIELLEE